MKVYSSNNLCYTNQLALKFTIIFDKQYLLISTPFIFASICEQEEVQSSNNIKKVKGLPED